MPGPWFLSVKALHRKWFRVYFLSFLPFFFFSQGLGPGPRSRVMVRVMNVIRGERKGGGGRTSTAVDATTDEQCKGCSLTIFPVLIAGRTSIAVYYRGCWIR